MLPKEYRLKRMKDFEILFKEGWFVNDEFLTAKIWKITPEKYPKRDYKEDDLKIGFEGILNSIITALPLFLRTL